MKNKNNKIIIVICLITIILAIGISLGIKLYLSKDLEKAKQELQEIEKEYGTVEEETLNILIAKFNTEIMDNGLEYPASDDYLTIQDNNYWYGLYDDIYCYAVPEKYTGNKEKDIVEMIAIYYTKNSSNEELAIEYVRKLIKANNYDLTDNEINELINTAKKISTKDENAQSGKGIALAIKETEDYYNYQVIRLYK